jgi:hypothetical protein
MSIDTWPLESAVKGKVWTMLWSWISPTWLAGTFAAVMCTVPPGAMRSGLTVSVVACATTAQTPMSSRRTSNAARPMASLRRERLGIGLVAATVGGDVTTTVACCA